MFINYLQQAAVALVCVACGYVILHVILSYSFVSSKCAVPRSLLRVLEASRAVSRALNTSLGGVQREAFTLIWMCHLFAGCCWSWKCYSTSLRRWDGFLILPKLVISASPCHGGERGSRVCLCKYIFCSSPSCPLLLFLSYFGAEGMSKVTSRSREVTSLLLPWLAFSFGYPRTKPVNSINVTKEVRVVVGCVTGGACSAWGRDCYVGTITGPDACGRCLGGTTGYIAA